MLYINYPATLTKTTCWRRRYKAAWPFLTIVLFYWHSVLFDGSIKGWNYLNTLIISVLSCVSDNYVMRLSERNNPLNCHFLSEDSFREIGDRDPISKIQESDLSSCCKVGLYYHGYSYHSVLLYYVIAGSFLIKCSPQNDNKVQCDWPVCCHAVSWNAETFFPFYLSVSSLELGCKQKKKTPAGIGEDLCLIVTILPEMDVGVSKSHVFLNYSPRALFSQWDTHLHGAAVGSCVVPALFTVGLPPVHSVSVWEL